MISVKNRFVHTAPRKIRLILDAIRGLPVDIAEAKLRFTVKQPAKDVHLTLKSAMAAAKDQGFDTKQWIISGAFCDEGPRVKRRTLISRGRARPINKQMSHIHISLAPQKTIDTKEKPTLMKEGNHGA